MTLSKVLTVSEYQAIFSESACPVADSTEIEKYKTLPDEQFEEFVNYIDATTPSVAKEDDKTVYFTVGRRQRYPAIIATNYVGIVQLPSGKRIEVLPKIYFGADSNVEINDKEERNKTRNILLKMVYSLHHYGARDYGTANLSVGEIDIFESLIGMYVEHVDRLIKRGLKSDYIHYEENQRFLKGKLLLNQHIETNFAHAERFYIGYEIFDVNRPENKLIKATLELFARISINYENQQMIRRQLIHFELVEASINHDYEFSKVTFNRTNKEYEQLMIWSKVFLRKKSFLPKAGSDSAITLLYPMEKLFEAYVGQEVKRIFENHGEVQEVHLQHRKHYLFEQTQPVKHSIFRLIPDVAIESALDLGKFVVMDTKWKKISSDASNKYGISQTDLYQMYAYSKKYAHEQKGAPVWLIYPKTEKTPIFENGNGIIFEDEADKSSKVKLFFVDLADLTQSVSDLFETMIEDFGPKPQ